MSSAVLATPERHLGQNLTRQRSQSPACKGLQSFARGPDEDPLDGIIASLRLLQRKAGSKIRYHLFVETEDAAPPRATPSSGPENENRVSYNVDVKTKVLYSPTISFSRQGERHRKLARNLVCSISELSFLSLRPAPGRQQNNAAPLLSEIRRPIPKLFQSDEDESIDDDLFSIEPFVVPFWFPFTESEYRHGLPISSADPLLISADIASKFDSLSNDDISNLYRTFFEVLHMYAKRKKRGYKQGKLKYSMFTPPWLRARIIVSGDICQMPKLAIQDQREQRNRQGYKRMAWIMAAFYDKETCFGRYVLDYLLDKLPLLREEWNQRNENRRQHATPIQRALAGSGNKRIASRVSPRNRQVRRKLNAAEAPGSPPMLETQPEHISEHVDIRQNSVTPRKRNINGGVLETVPASSHANERASFESVNKPIEEPFRSPSKEQSDVLKSRSKALKSVFDRVSSRNGDRPSSATNHVQIRDEERDSRNGERSQLLSGGPPVIALSSGSSGNRPPVTKRRVNRRLDIPLKTVENEVEKAKHIVQRRRQKQSSNNRRSRTTPNSIGANNQSQRFMSVHGVSFNLPDDEFFGSNDEELQTARNSTDMQTRTISDVNENSQSAIHEITCAANTRCLFRDSADAQDPNSITGRCNGCSKHLHDLCGGGEDGEMICPTCKSK